MGLNDTEQAHIESVWLEVEANTDEAIDGFFRDYLILRTGRDSEVSGNRGVFATFRNEFPSPRYATLSGHADEWRSYSRVYRVLLDPSCAGDDEVGRHLGYVNTFGSAMYPLLLAVYRDYEREAISRDTLLEILGHLQSLYLRRMVIGASRDHVAAQLCRKRRQYGYPITAIGRLTPSDERVSEGLAYRPLPHAGYVLGRLAQVDTAGSQLQIEHIFPQFAAETWSGDGTTQLRDLSEADRAKYREILQTIGNLVLLEGSLNAGASNKSFAEKKNYYARSNIAATRALATLDAWDLPAVAIRTRQLTDNFLQVWRRTIIEVTDDTEYLVPILDVQRKPGWYKGWATEFEYVVFCGEIWEVHNVKILYRDVFTRLWQTRRTDVIAYNAALRDKVIFESEAWPSQWAPLGEQYLFMGLFPQYLLKEVQGILDHLNNGRRHAREVRRSRRLAPGHLPGHLPRIARRAARQVEPADPCGERFPRPKRSDDATAAAVTWPAT
jgi:hypothetical protein